MNLLLGIIAVAILLYLLLRRKKKTIKYTGPVPESWKQILSEKVHFYRALSEEEKTQFENRIQHFLNTTRITGIQTSVELSDSLLTAASAIIPVFAFPEWEYANLSEVLLYADSFNRQFESGTGESNILGMVGSGYMEGKMILSKSALQQGFANEKDKKNVGIHEFVHLIDKADGAIDGLPEVLLKHAFALPWLDLIRKQMKEIHAGRSDVNPYGGVSEQEFFPVIAEYFFEQPELLKKKHPDLYKNLTEIFSVDLSEKYQHIPPAAKTGRNDPCPCGSGKKFKECCGEN